MIINPIEEKLDIIVLAGQSNAQGCGIGPTTMLWSVDTDILMLNGVYLKKDEGNDIAFKAGTIRYTDDFKISIADERHAEGYRRGVLALPFAKRYKEDFLEKDRKILIISVARGGTSFVGGHWTDGGVLRDQMLRMIKDALAMNKENRLVAFLWHQGESDAFRSPHLNDEELYETYKNNVKNMVNGVREKFNDVPFICGGFNKEYYNMKERSPIVEKAQEGACVELSDAAFVQGNDLDSNNLAIANGDRYHFSRESIYTLGNRYFDAYSKIMKGE